MLFWGAEEPNYFVDISKTYETKLAALRCHRSQLGQFSKDWEGWFRDMHTWHADKHTYDLAEAFFESKYATEDRQEKGPAS